MDVLQQKAATALDELTEMILAEGYTARESADATLAAAGREEWVITGTLAVAIIAASLLFATVILRPLRMAMGAARTIAEGNLDEAIGVRRRDEFGALLKALETMRSELRQQRDQAGEWPVSRQPTPPPSPNGRNASTR
jgi:methyl-accepting chemotaxis protein